MRSKLVSFRPATEAEWDQFAAHLNRGQPNQLLQSLVRALHRAGAKSVVLELVYIDRDFSAAYAAFYATLFRPYPKHCARAHFFGDDVAEAVGRGEPAEVIAALQDAAPSYLGNVVVRPLQHAPVSSAHLSAAALANGPHNEIGVRSTFKFHLMGVELSVEAMPLTQQDTRTGACAQATMWMAGRHFHNRHGSPWFSLPDITSVALNPADNIITRSLPAGSDFLTPDNMVRALRSMGRHPVMFAPDPMPDGAKWLTVDPAAIVTRYVDSGIPVILGLQKDDEAIGHAVVAVGLARTAVPLGLKPWATTSSYVTTFLVHDDQRGAYCELPADGDAAGDYPFRFSRDIRFLIVPLPEKVFVTAEVAELIAVDCLNNVSRERVRLAQTVEGIGVDWNVDDDFYDRVTAGQLVSRTYLTHGWKYKARMLRNGVSDRLARELLFSEFPRYVWVTEFSLPDDCEQGDPLSRMIKAHVVVDATGSRFWDSVLLVDTPGLSIFWHYDPNAPSSPYTLAIRADTGAEKYYPKVRGQLVCPGP